VEPLADACRTLGFRGTPVENHWCRWMKFCTVKSRWRRPPFWISSVALNSFIIAHICTKFGMCITLEVLYAGMPKYWTKIKSKMPAAAILDFCTNSNISAADWCRWMKFCSHVEGCYRKSDVRPKGTKIINSRWRRPPFWIWSIVHNSFTVAHILRNLPSVLRWRSYMHVCQNFKQKFNPRCRQKPSWIFAQTVIFRPPIDID